MTTNVSESRKSRLGELLQRMPPKLLHTLIGKYGIDVPDDISEYVLADFLLREFSDKQKEEIISDYRHLEQSEG
jgi:hypothetical protein